MSRRITDALIPTLLVAIVPLLGGCDLVEGIFKIGLWAGIIIVVLIVLVVAAIFRFVGRRA